MTNNGNAAWNPGRSMRVIMIAAAVAHSAPVIGNADRASSFATTAERPRVAQAPAGSVNLYRDERGIAHLYAEREEDGWFGLGYAQAEDRLEGILLYYLMLRSELAAQFGAGPVGDKHGVAGLPPVQWDDAVASDLEMLRGGFLADARRNLPGLQPEVRANLTAFVAGIARYMADNPDRVPSWAPVLEPALPLAAEALMMGGVSGPPAGCEPADAEQKQSEPGGSNIFAVAGSRTPDGAALFASDSHGPIAIFGTFFHPARIRAGPVDAFLVDIAGLPIGLKGHGSHFAWGWAEGPRRPADCLVVETSGADGRTFRIDGKPQRLQAEPFRLRIAGSDDVVGAIETSRHNGVRSVVVRREGRRAFIISSAYSGRAGGAARQFRNMLLASDWGAMMKALDAREIYPGNIAIGGPNGGILFARPGRIPVRPAGSSGAAPVSGETSATAWRGIRPFSELVQLRDPAPGYIANANVSPDMMYGQPLIDPAGFPEDFAFEPGRTGTRQRRAIELLETGQPINLEQFLLVVGDANVPGHEGWATALAAARLGSRVESAGAEEEFHQRLLQFDGHFVPQSEGALAHAAWRLALRTSTDPSARAVEQAIAKGELPDEAGLALLLQAARDAMAWLAGTDPEASTFGAVFRTGRGDHDAPARGLTLLPLEGDSGELTDFGSLWSSVYTERAEDGRMVHRSGTRLPFAVHLADPIRSMSHVVQGVDDRPEGRHHSDQAGDYGEAVFRWNHLQAEDLARHLTAARTLVR